MDNNKLEDKLDKVIEQQGEMNVTLAKQSVILEEHVKRTNLLELKIAPIEKHVVMVHGVLKFIGILGILAAIVESVVKVLVGG